MRFFLLLASLVTAACAVSPETDPPTPPAQGDAFDLQWSTGQDRACEECTPRWVVDCGHVISHPCPYLTFTTRLGIEGACQGLVGACAVWGSATGGSDSNGVPAENLGPFNDAFMLDASGGLTLAQRGDDGGLRHATVLNATAEGFEGDVTWLLFNEAGWTTFHVVGRRE